MTIEDMNHSLNGIFKLLRSSEEVPFVVTLEMFAVAFECDVATYWILDPKAHLLRESRSWYSSRIRPEKLKFDSSKRTFQMGEGMPGKTWKFRKVFISNDLPMDMSLPRSLDATSVGLCSGFWLPIVSEQSVLGVVELLKRDPILDPDEAAGLLGKLISEAGPALHGKTVSNR